MESQLGNDSRFNVASSFRFRFGLVQKRKTKNKKKTFRDQGNGGLHVRFLYEDYTGDLRAMQEDIPPSSHHEATDPPSPPPPGSPISPFNTEETPCWGRNSPHDLLLCHGGSSKRVIGINTGLESLSEETRREGLSVGAGLRLTSSSGSIRPFLHGDMG